MGFFFYSQSVFFEIPALESWDSESVVHQRVEHTWHKKAYIHVLNTVLKLFYDCVVSWYEYNEENGHRIGPTV